MPMPHQPYASPPTSPSALLCQLWCFGTDRLKGFLCAPWIARVFSINFRLSAPQVLDPLTISVVDGGK